jgi:hypothetical protein
MSGINGCASDKEDVFRVETTRTENKKKFEKS